jgi:hypothetical protein
VLSKALIRHLEEEEKMIFENEKEYEIYERRIGCLR